MSSPSGCHDNRATEQTVTDSRTQLATAANTTPHQRKQKFDRKTPAAKISVADTHTHTQTHGGSPSTHTLPANKKMSAAAANQPLTSSCLVTSLLYSYTGRRCDGCVRPMTLLQIQVWVCPDQYQPLSLISRGSQTPLSVSTWSPSRVTGNPSLAALMYFLSDKQIVWQLQTALPDVAFQLS